MIGPVPALVSVAGHAALLWAVRHGGQIVTRRGQNSGVGGVKVPKPGGADSPGSSWATRLGQAARDQLQQALLAWYRPRARPLRIRETNDPWAVLVAEVMAQQTQISRVDEAWVGFMARFPGSSELAVASPAEVLRAWSGLGYNRRAIALQRTAQLIETEHGGRVPADLEALEALPGIGPYTARAVMAVAHGRPVAAVDTNVRRVISRLVGAPMSTADLQATADWLVRTDGAATWTHASMDLGATVCRSRHPRCEECPLRGWCASAGSVESGARTTARARAPAAGRGIPFELTTRWLRGRIVARLIDVQDGHWAELPTSIGQHGPEQVSIAVVALERDGLLERRSDGTVRLPSDAT